MEILPEDLNPLVEALVGNAAQPPRIYFVEGLLGSSPDADYVRLYLSVVDDEVPANEAPTFCAKWIDIRRDVVRYMAAEGSTAARPSGWNGLWLDADRVDDAGDRAVLDSAGERAAAVDFVEDPGVVVGEDGGGPPAGQGALPAGRRRPRPRRWRGWFRWW